MFTPSLAIVVISLFIWIVLAFFHGKFWLLASFDNDAVQPGTLERWPAVVAVIPARNEAGTIAQTVATLAAQHYAGKFHIIVVDDHSEDGTARLALQAAKNAKATDRAQLISALPLEAGWTGKLWAMQQGVTSGKRWSPDYWWFTDADITHSPDTLQRLVWQAETRKCDLVSLMVLLQAKSLAEKILIPPFLYFFLKLYPPLWIADRGSQTAGAAGGCILLKCEVLEVIGGFATIRDRIIDDCALAAAVKNRGISIWMGLTRKSVSLRSYTSFGEIQELVARTAFTQLRYRPLALLGTLIGMFLTYLAPMLFLFNPSPLLRRVSLLTCVLMLASYLPTVRYYRLSALYTLTLPLAAGSYSYATWLSATRYWTGKGGVWKGRAQAPRRQQEKR